MLSRLRISGYLVRYCRKGSLGRYRRKRPRLRDLTQRYEAGELDADPQLDRDALDAPRGKPRKVGTTEDDPQKDRHARSREGLLAGTVLSIGPGSCRVRSEDKEYACVLRGILTAKDSRRQTVLAVGDKVYFSLIGEDEGAVEQVGLRRTVLTRRGTGPRSRLQHIIAANVDQVVVVASASNPTFRPRLIDRYLVAAEYGELEAVVCINKIDLDPEGVYEPSLEVYRSLGYPAIATSAIQSLGLDELRELLTNKTSVLAGQSGVGKSSLLSAVEPGLELKTSKISSKTNKGQHATKNASLLNLSFGGYVIDTPGIRQFSLWDVPAVDLAGSYPEIAHFGADCRFQPCSHVKEIDCTVKAALEEDEIFLSRYESYVSLYQELLEREKSRTHREQ